MATNQYANWAIMQSKQVDDALKNFACHQERRAVVLKGDWGVGKTHLWNRVLESNKNDIPLKKYSYVSLFGLGSLKDLKRSIFENATDTSTVGQKIDSQKTLIKNLEPIGSKLSSYWRKFISHSEQAKLPIVGGISSVVESIQFSMIKDTLICIDDFERRGSSLSARDTLGLISHLVDSKNCSVILVLNENSLKENDEYFSFSEKVFDYEIVYSPTPSETANLIFTDDRYTSISKNSVRLGINNIRLLKKVKLFYDAIYEHLTKAPTEIVESASLTIPLCVFSIYGGTKCPVEISFIESFEGITELPPEEEETPEGAKKIEKMEFLHNCKFYSCDELDFEIIRLIKNGYPNEEALSRTINTLEENIKHTHNTQLLQNAWRQFNSNFTNNKPEIIALFRQAIAACSNSLNINDLNYIGWLYAGLGMTEEFHTLVDKHFEIANAEQPYKDHHDIFRWPDDTYLCSKLNEYFLLLDQPKPLPELIVECCEENNFSIKALKQLASTTPEDFYNVLNTLEHSSLPTLIRRLLECGNIRADDEETRIAFRTIFLNTWQALVRIGEESDLNKLRVSRFIDKAEIYERILREMEQKASSQASSAIGPEATSDEVTSASGTESNPSSA